MTTASPKMIIAVLPACSSRNANSVHSYFMPGASVWSASPATALVYMDIDLSTGLDALLPLVAPIVSGHSDVVVGSRRLHITTAGEAKLEGFKSRATDEVRNALEPEM